MNVLLTSYLFLVFSFLCPGETKEIMPLEISRLNFHTKVKELFTFFGGGGGGQKNDHFIFPFENKHSYTCLWIHLPPCLFIFLSFYSLYSPSVFLSFNISYNLSTGFSIIFPSILSIFSFNSYSSFVHSFKLAGNDLSWYCRPILVKMHDLTMFCNC